MSQKTEALAAAAGEVLDKQNRGLLEVLEHYLMPGEQVEDLFFDSGKNRTLVARTDIRIYVIRGSSDVEATRTETRLVLIGGSVDVRSVDLLCGYQARVAKRFGANALVVEGLGNTIKIRGLTQEDLVKARRVLPGAGGLEYKNYPEWYLRAGEEDAATDPWNVDAILPSQRAEWCGETWQVESDRRTTAQAVHRALREMVDDEGRVPVDSLAYAVVADVGLPRGGRAEVTCEVLSDGRGASAVELTVHHPQRAALFVERLRSAVSDEYRLRVLNRWVGANERVMRTGDHHVLRHVRSDRTARQRATTVWLLEVVVPSLEPGEQILFLEPGVVVTSERVRCGSWTPAKAEVKANLEGTGGRLRETVVLTREGDPPCILRDMEAGSFALILEALEA